MNNTDSLCHKCGSISGVYLHICDDCMTRLNRLDSVDRPESIDSTRVSKARAERCVTHSYACDCREYRHERMRAAAIDLLYYFYVDGDQPRVVWGPAEALRQAVGISVEDLREQA